MATAQRQSLTAARHFSPPTGRAQREERFPRSNKPIFSLCFWKHPESLAVSTGDHSSLSGMRPNLALLSGGKNLGEENHPSTVAQNHIPQPQAAPEDTHRNYSTSYPGTDCSQDCPSLGLSEAPCYSQAQLTEPTSSVPQPPLVPTSPALSCTPSWQGPLQAAPCTALVYTWLPHHSTAIQTTKSMFAFRKTFLSVPWFSYQ